MAQPTCDLIEALRTTARRLSGGADYQWGHPGACNCGHLAQTVTELSRAELMERAKQRAGDWGEMVVEACPTSGLPIDWVIGRLLALGLTRDELAALEDLSDAKVLRRLRPELCHNLRRNRRDDVVLYLETFADLLAEQRAEGSSGSGRDALHRSDPLLPVGR